jgi:hypothetical protein
MTLEKRRRRPLGTTLAGTGAVLLATVVTAGAFTPSAGAASTPARPSMSAMAATAPENARQAALYTAMRSLWEQHMEWTYSTVAAFAGNPSALQPALDRLLRNQADLGNAIKPFYGRKAGDTLHLLLRTHILDAVPVLKAAKAGDTASLARANKDWYANAKRIADFLAEANPHWAKGEMERMMRTHITQTLAYAADQLQGDYAKSIRDYGRAEAHMMSMADMLSSGIVRQFPKRF